MDDTSKHESSDDEDIKNDPDHTGDDEGDDTPADTGDGEPKTPAEKAKEQQKESWLTKIKSGEKTLDDMPGNLGWLRKEIEPELKKGERSEVKEDELDKRVKEALKKERDKEDLELLVEDLEQNTSSEKLAQVKEEYESLRAEGVSALKALVIARRLVGLHDSQTVVSERRRKGMLLPPNGSRRRDTVDKDKMTEIEKRLSGNLPPGFKT